MSVLIPAGVSLIVALFTSLLSRERLRQEFALEFAAETAVKALLRDPEWKCRTFETIKKRLGGFEEVELRRLLVRAGAIRAYRDNDGAEIWGLASRNRDLLKND